MHEGRVVAKGTPQQMDSNPLVSKLFIGDVTSEGVAAGSPAPGSDEPYSAAAQEGALPVASAKRDHSMAATPNPPTPEPGTLNVRNLSAGYRRMTVVSDVCMTVARGEIVALLGRNGAGKSTALLATAGTIRPHKGSVVELDGLALHGHRPEAIASRGLALVAQGHRVFPEMTVAENLRIGAFARRRLGRRVLDTDLSCVYDLFPVLKQFGQRPAGQLSGGQQQMVVIGQVSIQRLRGAALGVTIDEKARSASLFAHAVGRTQVTGGSAVSGAMNAGSDPTGAPVSVRSAFFLAGWSCALRGTGFAPVTRAARLRCKSTADLTAPGSAVGLFVFMGSHRAGQPRCSLWRVVMWGRDRTGAASAGR
jgi:ABC-type branched-subunit amino acid transport system ATPase component